MLSPAMEQLLLMVAQALLLGALILGIFRYRHQLGLSPLYIALGVFQHLQVILSASLYVEVLPGILISPGSAVLFTGSLFAILLVYIGEDALEARKLIYGLLGANITLGLFSYLVGLHLDSSATQNFYQLPRELFVQQPRVLLIGTVVLGLDALCIILFYEFICKWLRGPWLRIYVTLALVLAVDTFLFVTGNFLEQPNYGSLLLAGLGGKAFIALFYSLMLAAYLRWLPPRENGGDVKEIRDLFHILTYRQKFDKVKLSLAEKDIQLRQIMDLVPHPVFARNQNDVYFLANKAMAATHGMAVKDLLGKTPREVHPNPAECDRILAEDREVMTTRRAKLLSTDEFVDADGQQLVLQTNKIPFWDSQANLPAVLGVSIDITQLKRVEDQLRKHQERLEEKVRERTRKLESVNDQLLREIREREKANRALKESEERFRQLAENISEVFWVYDFGSQQFLYLNKAFEGLSGRTCESLYQNAKLFFDLFFPEDLPGIKDIIQQLKMGKDVKTDHRLRFIDGSVKWVRLITAPLENEHGEVYRFVGVSEDITRQKEHEAQLQQLIEQKNQILRITAHDLKNPLNGIIGFADLVETTQNDALDTIKYCADEMLRIIDGLLKAEAIEAGKLVLEKRPVNLAELLDGKKSYFRKWAAQKGQKIQLEIEPECRAIADSLRIKEAMENYVSNAVKYAPKKSDIAIALTRKGEVVRFSVRDRGPGLTDEDKKLVFGKFQRLTAKPTGGESSSGLGLSIVKSLVEMHEGRVGVYNNPDGGCTFFFEIPVQATPVALESG